MTHWMPASEACRWDWMAGLATATIVPSRPTIITPSATASSVRRGLPRSRGRPPPASAGGLPPRATAVAAVVRLHHVISFPARARRSRRVAVSVKDKCQLLTYTMNQIAGRCQMSLADIRLNGR